MRYYKMTDADGNLTAIGTGSGGVEITEEEYAALAKEIEQKAALVDVLADGRISTEDIREDWREEIVRRAAAVSASADTYTRESLEAMTNADLEIILAGMGISANMTKANNLEMRAMKSELATDQQYRELKGRYDELERRYQELQEQQKRLTDILDRMSQSQGR